MWTLLNTTLDKLAVGSVFRFWHDAKDIDPKWVKVSERMSRPYGREGPVLRSCADEEDPKDIKVTYFFRVLR